MKVSFLDVAAQNAEVGQELRAAFDRVVQRGNLILGVELEAFEAEWTHYCGVPGVGSCVGVGNGLDAVTLMLRAYGIGQGDEVIVPSNTYIATWLAVSAVGARPVPVEPDSSYNIDPNRVGPAITKRTKAILAVHLYGRPADMVSLREIADRHGLRLLVDAAQAHGIKGEDLGDAAAFSFYPTKNLGCLGDGGAVVTGDETIAAKVRLLRNYGSRRKYENEILGVNSRLDEIQAAFLRAKLPKLDEWNARRKRHAENFYGERAPGSVWHQCVIRVSKRSVFLRDRAAFIKCAAERGVETLIHYPVPPHLQPAYAWLGYQRGDFPIAEEMADEVVSLPIGPELSEEAIRYARSCF